MRNELIGFVSALALASALATVGCTASPSPNGTGGSPGHGGATGTGGGSSRGGTTGTGGCACTGGKSGSGGAVGGAGGSSSNGGQGGGGTGAGTSVTSLGDSKALNALSAADATQLCKDVYAYFGKTIPMATACKYKGLSYATSSSAPTDAQFQKACTDHEAACTQANSGVGSATDPGCGDLPPKCTATIAQYSACITDEVAAFLHGMDGLPSCATSTTAGNSAVWVVMVPPTAPASCDSLTQNCPELSPPVPNN